MHRYSNYLGALLLVATMPVAAQTPVNALLKPPATARHFIIESVAAKHGDSWVWVTADGIHAGRESVNLRGQIFEVDYTGKPGPDGMPAKVVVRGVTPQGDAAENFSIAANTARWKSPIDSGSTAYSGAAYYFSVNGPIADNAWFLEQLLAAPHHSLALLPGGKAQAEKLTSLVLMGASPAARITVDLWSITGISSSPAPMWADRQGRFFAQTGGIGWLPEGYATQQATLEAAQSQAMTAQSARLAKQLLTMPAAPVAFTHVRLFDSEGERFLADQTVVVDHGRITAVGAAATTAVPVTAQLIDGRGKTLVAGMWDSHQHVGDDYTGVTDLSLGVTSVRDPGNNDLKTIDRRSRIKAGELLFPHVYPSELIDGRGPYTAQLGVVATSQAQAIDLIDRAKANDFTAIKFYGTFNSAWLPAAIAEAHRLGLHVHGHIPVGIRPMDAINDGYDEVTHINWVIMQAMPDSVIAVSNGIARFEGPGRYGKDVDLNGPAMKLIVSTMAARHIYNDPTMVAFEGFYVPDNGDLSPALLPFVGTLPPAVERGFRAGGFAVPKDLTRADYRASWAKMVALLKKMHEAGIPIVAGTDGPPMEIIHELEIYEQAGFTAAQALAAATIVPARLLGQDRNTGSIKVGKTADLVLVQGDPSKRIGDLRQTRIVMLDGKLLDADALRTAAGFSGRPK
jgi:imidazolonepropionase-like amidohydrolase